MTLALCLSVTTGAWAEEAPETQQEQQTAQVKAPEAKPKTTIKTTVNKRQCTVQILNAQTTGTVTLAAWSNTKGKDDLRWYTAKRSGSTYTATFKADNHKLDTGAYQVQAYTGKQLIAATTASIPKIQYKTSRIAKKVKAKNIRTGKKKTLKKGTKLYKAGKTGKNAICRYKGDAWYVKNAKVTSEACYKGARKLKHRGVLRWRGWKWTWYSQRSLPGKGLKIPGRHVDANGFVCDKNDYICLAANTSHHIRGKVVNTPLGKKGKVYDAGCRRGTMDVYVAW